MVKKEKVELLENLPHCAAEFIKLVIKKMRYRKKVRAEVMAELAAHFEDGLRECKTDEEKDKRAQQLIPDFGDVKLLAVLLRRAKKRCRPLWRTVVARTFQTLVILILCFIVYTAWFLTGRPVITIDYVAQLNRIVRPVADEGLNAASLYGKAVALYDERASDDISELLGKKYNEATDEQKKFIAKWLEDNKEIFNLVIAGTQKPYYWQNYESKTGEVISILMPNLAGLRSLAYALRWRAHLLAEQSQYQDALDDIKTCYRFGQHQKGNTGLIEQLVGMAIEDLSVRTLRSILSEHEIDPAALTTLQRDFEQIIAGEDFAASLKAEKLFMYDEIQRCFTEDRLGGGHLYLSRLWAFGEDDSAYSDELIEVAIQIFLEGWANPAKVAEVAKGAVKVLFTHPNKKQSREMADRYYDLWEKIVHKTPAQIRAEGIDTEKETMEIIKANLLLQILAPALGRVNEISHRNKADVEATLTLIAILRYRQDFGSYPEDLDKLIEAGLLKTLPIDPYGDKPLVYKKTDDNFVLYGFGPNFKDDGGKVFYSDKGTAMWRGSKDEGDAVFWPVYK